MMRFSLHDDSAIWAFTAEKIKIKNIINCFLKVKFGNIGKKKGGKKMLKFKPLFFKVLMLGSLLCFLGLGGCAGLSKEDRVLLNDTKQSAEAAMAAKAEAEAAAAEAENINKRLENMIDRLESAASTAEQAARRADMAATKATDAANRAEAVADKTERIFEKSLRK
jgi:hypothetical protein